MPNNDVPSAINLAAPPNELAVATGFAAGATDTTEATMRSLPKNVTGSGRESVARVRPRMIARTAATAVTRIFHEGPNPGRIQ